MKRLPVSWIGACLAVLVAGLWTSPEPLRAQDDGGDGTSTEGALFLLLPVGAKSVALGRAMTAMDGSESVFWNPAGLTTVRQSQIVLLRGDHLVGPSTAITGLWAREGIGTLGASYLLLDAGDQELRDSNGNVLGNLTVRNHLGVVSAAAQVLDRLRAGINVKMVVFRYSCQGQCLDAGTTATTYAIDAGIQALLTDRLRFGAVVAHLGPEFQVLNAEQADPLPARVRVGLAYDYMRDLTEDEQLSGWLTVEVQDRLRDPGTLSLYVGTELSAGSADLLSLRAGYVIGDQDQEEGARVGLGLSYEQFDLSIAKSLAVSTLTGESEPVQVTFAIRF